MKIKTPIGSIYANKQKPTQYVSARVQKKHRTELSLP